MRVKCVTLLTLGISAVTVLTSGCHKKAAVAQPAPPPVQEVAPPPPALPTASISAEPSAIEPGQAVTLTWSSSSATEATISGLGTVAVEGKQEVRPETSTTYEFVAVGPGGTATASATVKVVLPPPIVTPPPAPPRSLQERMEELSDVYFDYDKSDIREDSRAGLAMNSLALRSILADFPGAVIVLEGHCDERGSAEYNIGLGDRRSEAASAYLAALGIPAERLKPISYGKERPQCTESTEACWQKNRRVHFVAETPATN